MFGSTARFSNRLSPRYSLPVMAAIATCGKDPKRIHTKAEKGTNRQSEPCNKDKHEASDWYSNLNKFDASWLRGSVGAAIGDVVGSGKSPRAPGLEDDIANDNYQDMGKMLMKLLLPRSSNSLSDVLVEVQEMSGRGDIQDVSTVTEVLDVAKRCQTMLDSKLAAFFGEEGIPPLQLQQLFYFIEREDEIKNPTWKRRKHFFFPGIDMKQMEALNEKLKLTELAYTDTIEEVRDRLDKEFDSELVYCSSQSLPNKPAHFIAVKRDQSTWSTQLEVILVVCGTKRVTDVITDLLCDAEPYRGGYAHSGIRESGQWIAKKHLDLLEKLRTLSNKRKVKLTLLGHSLGAGAATIAGIELNDNPFVDVEVVGFGCPALLSHELSSSCQDIVTTVIGDNDCVPRMSMATMVNALVDITAFDYTPFAVRDIEQIVNELERYLPSIVDTSLKDRILQNVNSLLPDLSSKTKSKISKRMDVVLYPPGRCIHFYSDGFGTAGSVVPCTFFDEIDINRRLLHDHLIKYGYQRIFLDIMRQYKDDHHYRFNKEN